MNDKADREPFTAADLELLGQLVVEAWSEGLDRDWSAPAGTLEWNCFKTADHTIDCVFSYALFLASERQDMYPPFSELHALPEAAPADLVNGLQAVVRMLVAVITKADPDVRAVIRMQPNVEVGQPQEFATRGGLELILHAHDVCAGLGIDFDPPQDLCRRLRDQTRDWPDPATRKRPHPEQRIATDDPWGDLLQWSGRPRRA